MLSSQCQIMIRVDGAADQRKGGAPGQGRRAPEGTDSEALSPCWARQDTKQGGPSEPLARPDLDLAKEETNAKSERF